MRIRCRSMGRRKVTNLPHARRTEFAPREMSSFVKQQLKTARDAIQSKNFEYAQGLCQDILENDSNNYNALVFLGLCYKELDQYENAKETYEKAISSQPLQPLAYQGLIKLQENEGNLRGLLEAWKVFNNVHFEGKDGKAFLKGLDTQLELARKLENQDLIIELLEEYLPGSKGHHLVQDLLDSSKHPITILLEILEFKSKSMNENMAKELEKRRMRLNSDPLPVLRLKVEKEFILAYNLDAYYDRIIEYSDGESSVKDKGALLNSYFDYLIKKTKYTAVDEGKIELREKLSGLAQDLVKSQVLSVLALEFLFLSQNSFLSAKDTSCMDSFQIHLQSSQEPSSQIILAVYKHLKKEQMSPEDIQVLMEDCDNNSIGNWLVSVLSNSLQNDNVALEYAQKSLKSISEFSENFAIDLDQPKLELELITAFSYGQMNEMDQALNLYKSLVMKYPSHKAPQLGLARIYISIGKIVEAQACLEKVLLAFPNDVEVEFELGWIAFHQQKFEEAMAVFKTVTESFPTAISHYRLARVYWELGGDYKNEKSFCHANLIQAIKLDPSYSPSFTFLGDFYRIQENDLIRATKCYSKAIAINFKDQDAIRSLSSIWISQGKETESIQLLKQFVEVVPRSGWAWKQLGILSLDKEPSASISYFQSALRILPSDATTWLCLGEAYSKEGKYVAALKALERSNDMDPSCKSASYIKGHVHFVLGNYVESLEAYNSVLESTDNLKAQVPILYGISESRIEYAKELFEMGAYGLCLDQLEDIVISAQKLSSSSSSLFKISADALILMYKLVPKLIRSNFGSLCHNFIETLTKEFNLDFKGSNSNDTTLLVLECASALYQICVQSTPQEQVGWLYYDLGLSYYYRFLASGDDEILSFAIKYNKTALSFLPDSWIIWNSLGVYCKQVDQGLAQHSFIKATESDTTKALPWTNLGFFYLVNHDLELAMSCFEKAQFVDLDFTFGWLGSALTSEITGSEKTFELFEHSFDIGGVTNTEILYQYARQCYMSKTNLDNASFALQKCLEMNEKSYFLINLYGLILEKQKRTKLAIDMFRLALLDTKDSSQQSAIEENLARCLCAEGLFEESAIIFTKTVENGGDAYCAAGLGLALFLGHKPQESLLAFQKALELSQKDSKDIQLVNDVNLVLSQVLFAIGTSDHIALAKQQLFQCFASDPNFIPAVISLCSLGVVLEDWTLAQTAAMELLKIEPHIMKEFDADADFVLGCLFLSSGQIPTMKRFLSKSIHRYPWKASRWSKLAEAIYSFTPLLSKICCRLSESASCLAAYSFKEHLPRDTLSSIQRTLGLSTLSYKGRTSTGQRQLSRALLMNPTDGKNWIALSIQLTCSPDQSLAAFRTCKSLSKIDVEARYTGWVKVLACNARLGLDLAENQIHELLVELDSVCSCSTGFLQQVAFTVLSRALEALNNTPAAIQALKQALVLPGMSSITPWNGPLYLLFQLYLKHNLIPTAIACLHQIKQESLPLLLEAAIKLECREDSLAFELAGKINHESSVGRFIQSVVLARSEDLGGGVKKKLARIDRNKSLMAGFIDQVALEWLDTQIKD